MKWDGILPYDVHPTMPWIHSIIKEETAVNYPVRNVHQRKPSRYEHNHGGWIIIKTEDKTGHHCVREAQSHRLENRTLLAFCQLAMPNGVEHHRTTGLNHNHGSPVGSS